MTPDGQILVTLKAEWADGTTHLLFEPVELLEKLAALTPRPRINLLVYHGILAPHARDRARAVAHGGLLLPAKTREGRGTTAEPSATMRAHEEAAPVVATPVMTTMHDTAGASPAQAPSASTRNWTWAGLMQRIFAVDVLRCPRCGGRMSVIATIEAADVIRKILAHLGLPTTAPEPRPGRPPPGIPGLFPDELV